MIVIRDASVEGNGFLLRDGPFIMSYTILSCRGHTAQQVTIERNSGSEGDQCPYLISMPINFLSNLILF